MKGGAECNVWQEVHLQTRPAYQKLVVSDNVKTFNRNFFCTTELSGDLAWSDPCGRRVRNFSVCCVKRCLKKILKNANLTYGELLTVLVEIKWVHCCMCLQRKQPGTVCCLCYSWLICIHGRNWQFELLTKGQGYLTTSFLSHLWNRWLREYVVELWELHKAGERELPTTHSQLIEGTLSLRWRKGSLTRERRGAYPGHDGLVREQRNKLSVAIDNESVLGDLTKPIQKPFPFEVHNAELEMENYLLDQSPALLKDRGGKPPGIHGEMSLRNSSLSVSWRTDYNEHRSPERAVGEYLKYLSFSNYELNYD